MGIHSLNQSKSVSNKFRKLNLSDNTSIFFSARKGIKPTIFYHFAKLINMAEKELASIINLSARTVSNYEEQHKLLAPVESEHLLKLIALYSKGEEFFGNIAEFNYWLKKPFWNSDERPMDWLNTPGGVDLVMDELNRLAHGYAV